MIDEAFRRIMADLGRLWEPRMDVDSRSNVGHRFGKAGFLSCDWGKGGRAKDVFFLSFFDRNFFFFCKLICNRKIDVLLIDYVYWIRL